MNRRDFLTKVIGGCATVVALPVQAFSGDDSGDRHWDADVLLYDTYAMALYFDGSLGPRTGIVKAEAVIAAMATRMEFWHGHGGKSHFFTIEPAHFAEMKKLKKVTLETTEVEQHSHKLFVDFGDARWRVPGAKPIPVPIGAEEHDRWSY